MNDMSDTALPKRRRASRKAAKPVDAPGETPAEPAVLAILEHALHPDPAARAEVEDEVESTAAAALPAAAPAPGKSRRAPRKRGKSLKTRLPVPPQLETSIESANALAEPAAWAETAAPEPVAEAPIEAAEAAEPADEGASPPAAVPQDDGERSFEPMPPADGGPPGGHGAPPGASAQPSHHHWVYLALGVFLLSLGFGLWGAWTVFFAEDDASQSATALALRSDKLSQEVSTLRRSDQISRDANRDLERTLAERDEEIAGLRADIAFYESFVGATGQRRGLSVHDLDMQLQGGDAWHFVATLTQNLNRGAVNTGRVTLAVEGTRNDRLEKLSWSSLRKQGNAPGVAYSFKYFQQVEGEVMLPKGFKPLRVSVRLVPPGGSAVEQSFPWPETVRSGEGG